MKTNLQIKIICHIPILRYIKFIFYFNYLFKILDFLSKRYFLLLSYIGSVRHCGRFQELNALKLLAD